MSNSNDDDCKKIIERLHELKLLIEKEGKASNSNNDDCGEQLDEKQVESLKSRILKTAGVTGLTALGAAITAKSALVAAGFSSIGPVAGTIAATSQSTIGNVAAGSLFSFLQWAAMTGITPIIIPALGVGVVAGGGYWLYKSKL